MTAKPALGSMPGISYFSDRKTPRRLVRRSLSKSSTDRSARAVGRRPPLPALLHGNVQSTERGEGPVHQPLNGRLVCDICRDGERLSSGHLNLAHVLLESGSSRAASTTPATTLARASNVAAPIPLLAPVTSATLPCSVRVGVSATDLAKSIAVLSRHDQQSRGHLRSCPKRLARQAQCCRECAPRRSRRWSPCPAAAQ
jgi:hypothetical protein